MLLLLLLFRLIFVQSKVISREKFSSLLAYATLNFDMANVSRMRS